MKKYLTFLLFTLVFLPYTSADPDSEENAPEYKPGAGVFGYWNKDECKKVSETSGTLLYFAGIELKKSTKQREAGQPVRAAESANTAKYLAEMASLYAKNFEAYCKRPELRKDALNTELSNNGF